jgi:hypothetical protein
MRQAALGYDGVRLMNRPTNYDRWEADRIQGCLCDPGYEGLDCNFKRCPRGDDPISPGVPEVQTLTCECTGYCLRTEGAFFTVTFAGRMVRILARAVATRAEEDRAALAGAGNAVGESVEARLTALRDFPTISSVAFSWGTEACSANNRISITFLKSAGNVNEIVIGPGTVRGADEKPAFVQVETTQEGTTESLPCSARGICGATSGLCTCFTGFYSSDGNGNFGTIPDCGSATSPNNITTIVTTCPSIDCGGKGTCVQDPDGVLRCKCVAGWAGLRCSEQVCPRGPAWFDEPSGPDRAHELVECSNAGICDKLTGKCVCRAGFVGAACERINCPTEVMGVVCSGHGRCLSVRDLARAGSFGGRRLGSREVQEVTCTLGAGSFSLSLFKGTSVSLPFDVTVDELARAVEALPGVVAVRARAKPAGSIGACSSSGDGVTTELSFFANDDDLPLLEATVVGAAAGQGVAIVEAAKGSVTTYGADPFNPDTWDADMLFGCSCDGLPDWNRTDEENGDGSRWFGPTCSQRACPVGLNPLVNLPQGDVRPMVEVQTLTCDATDGSFALLFRGRRTRDIRWDEDERGLKRKLEELESVGVVGVEMSPAGSLCGSDGVETRITFLTELGDLPGELSRGNARRKGRARDGAL